MADRTYKIYLMAENLQDAKSPIAGDNKSSDTEKGKESGAKGGGSLKAIGSIVSYSTLKSFATQIVSHQVSTVELRTGSREQQERANFTYQLAQKGLGIIEGAVGGFMVGNLPGAIIGFLLSATHTAIGYAQKENTLNMQRDLENVSIGMNYLRAGVNGSRRGQQ